MNGIDVLVILLLAICAWSGARRGWRWSLLDLACLVVGVVFGIYTFPLAVVLLRKVLALPLLIAGPVGFLLMALLGSGIVWFAGTRLLSGRSSQANGDSASAPGGLAWRFANRCGGAAISLVMGCIGVGAFLMLIGMGASSREQIQRSALGRCFRAAMPPALGAAEHLGVDLPRVVMVPRELTRAFEFSPIRVPRFVPINFTKLNGSTCIKCRGKAAFLGYKWKDLSTPSPKFRCTVCGRTSDGCQTFEGFHKMYADCPFTLADQGALLDCGVWTNGDGVVPLGVCPVCGRRLNLRARGDFPTRVTTIHERTHRHDRG